MQISRTDLVNLITSLSSLDGRRAEVSDGDKKAVIVKPYDFDEKHNVRFWAAKMKKAAKPILQEFEDHREALFIKHAGDLVSQIKVGSLEQQGFNKDYREYMSETVEFAAAHEIPISAFKLGTNQFDPNLIEGLLPILTGEM